jgi:hypothetical protein
MLLTPLSSVIPTVERIHYSQVLLKGRWLCLSLVPFTTVFCFPPPKNCGFKLTSQNWCSVFWNSLFWTTNFSGPKNEFTFLLFPSHFRIKKERKTGWLSLSRKIIRRPSQKYLKCWDLIFSILHRVESRFFGSGFRFSKPN